MHHHFLCLVHSHPAVQPAGKGGPEVLQAACGGGGGDGYDALLAEAQRVGQRGPQGAHRADNMMAAEGIVSLISLCSFFVISLLAKIRRSPLSAHTQITEGCTKINEWLAQRIKTEEAPRGV